MTPARLQLKRAWGWFAAGSEVQQAALLLSDGAFKLFVWLCLHADRASGVLCTSAADLAGVLRKSEQDLTRNLDELSLTGVCRLLDQNHIEIQDRFWPYERIRSDSGTEDSAAYVTEVRRMFLKQACVRAFFTPADDRLAVEWFRRGVSLQRVERAILLGTLRKYSALLNHNGRTPITTLHYFSNLIEEVDQIDNSPDYWRYLAHKLEQVELRWRKMMQSLESSHQVETK